MVNLFDKIFRKKKLPIIGTTELIVDNNGKKLSNIVNKTKITLNGKTLKEYMSETAYEDESDGTINLPVYVMDYLAFFETLNTNITNGLGSACPEYIPFTIDVTAIPSDNGADITYFADGINWCATTAAVEEGEDETGWVSRLVVGEVSVNPELSFDNQYVLRNLVAPSFLKAVENLGVDGLNNLTNNQLTNN